MPSWMRPLTAKEAIMATARRPLLGRLLLTFSGFTRLPARSMPQQAEHVHPLAQQACGICGCRSYCEMASKVQVCERICSGSLRLNSLACVCRLPKTSTGQDQQASRSATPGSN